MNFAHSFWSKPLFENKFSFQYKFEEALLNTLLDYAYSVQLLHKYGYKITLYADKIGIDLFSVIPYDNVVEIDIPNNESIHFAAQPKFYALKQMNLGDILIDGDVFMETENIFDLIKSKECDCLYSFNETKDYIEKGKEIYVKVINKLKDTNGLLYSLPSIDNVSSINTSLIRLNNQELKNKFIDQYFYHKELLKNIDWGDAWPDYIIEQYFLLQISNKFSIKPLVQNVENYMDEEIGFIHLGWTKTIFQNRIRQSLYFLDKDLFKTVMKQYEKYRYKIIS